MKKEIFIEFLKLKGQEIKEFLKIVLCIILVIVAFFTLAVALVFILNYSLEYLEKSSMIDLDNSMHIMIIFFACISIPPVIMCFIQWVKSNWKQATKNVQSRRVEIHTPIS